MKLSTSYLTRGDLCHKVRSAVNCAMPTVQHPNVPWVSCNMIQPGIFQCRCSTCGITMPAPGTNQAADGFAAAHSQHQPTHFGAGDLVAKLTGALGIKPCSPCEARKRALNGMFPRVLRRR